MQKINGVQEISALFHNAGGFLSCKRGKLSTIKRHAMRRVRTERTFPGPPVCFSYKNSCISVKNKFLLDFSLFPCI